MSSATHLCNAALPALAGQGIRVPTYERHSLVPGVVHLGLGAFQRAHQALVFDDLLEAGDTRWGVLGVSSRSFELADALAEQDGLYSVHIQNAERQERRVVGAVLKTCAVRREPDQWLEAVAHPATRWITLTVTEKGYDAALGRLLVAGLRQRHGAGLGGLTIASCDNIRSNGEKLQALCLQAAKDAMLQDWITQHCRFPNSMVDRIVPAGTPDDRESAQAALGVGDQCALRTETFWQWVLEDKLADPADAQVLAGAGVTLVADVRPFEDAKLRMLNGSHSAMATLGQLMDLPIIGACIAQPDIRTLVHRLMTQEVMPHLTMPGLADYRDALIARFGNPTLRHSVHQIATDGATKIADRWVPSIEAQLAQGRGIDQHALIVAAWIWSCRGQSDQGQPYAVNDPRSEQLVGLALQHQNDVPAWVDAFMNLDGIWGPALQQSTGWRAAVQRWLQLIATQGTAAALARAAAEPGPV